MKLYDAAYFDRWYRDPRSRVISRGDRVRKVRMVVGIAEYVLERSLRSVLDVGCGEGAWQPILLRLRPGIRYVGVDPSPYVLRRFGRSRNLRPGRLEDLDELDFRGRFDLIVCSDVLHYLAPRELDRGLRHLRARLGGVAYLDFFTAADGFMGDRRGFRSRFPGYYRKLLRRIGLVPCGMQCYVPRELAAQAPALEQPFRDRA
jgi:SAM-dependent methyltransferase